MLNPCALPLDFTMSTVRTILVTGSNQGLGMETVHQLAAKPNVLIFMGSRKLAAAEEALAKFTVDVDVSSSVVPVQLDITDGASIKNAHAFIAEYLKGKGLPGLDVLINKGHPPAAEQGWRDPQRLVRAWIRLVAHPEADADVLSGVQLEQVGAELAYGALGKSGVAEGVRNPRGVDMPGGTMSPAEGCQVVVSEALKKEGRTAVFFNKDGDLAW
ncbi:hypothetical protein DFH09DRAFT_1409702 [Mycena vulgaris]|nr:hypothetical protein DFH09DRAFT_1409702 [Mycena vulgaris]